MPLGTATMSGPFLEFTDFRPRVKFYFFNKFGFIGVNAQILRSVVSCLAKLCHICRSSIVWLNAVPTILYEAVVTLLDMWNNLQSIHLFILNNIYLLKIIRYTTATNPKFKKNKCLLIWQRLHDNFRSRWSGVRRFRGTRFRNLCIGIIYIS